MRVRGKGKEGVTRLISVGLSAALARELAPRELGSVTWSGRGTEGMVLYFPASLGIVVPVTAILEREPPVWGSSLEDMFGD